MLADELRMFALAVSRSSELTVLSCVSNDDEQPSAFFGLAPDAEPLAAPRHPYSLRGLTGHLRRRLAEDGDRRAAAALARLAEAGVPGADPEDWYGLLPASTEDPLVDPDDPEAVVRVSPSRIEAFEQSPLMWFVDQVAGGSSSLAAGIGTIVHSVMETAASDPEADLSVDELMKRSEDRWEELRFEAPWIEQRERRALRTKIEGLSQYLTHLRAGGAELVGAEAPFSFRQGRAQVNGSIDRIERHPDGRLLVVDLKTGKYPIRAADVPGHAQLASYQLAVHHGAVEGLEAAGDAPAAATAPATAAPAAGAFDPGAVDAGVEVNVGVVAAPGDGTAAIEAAEATGATGSRGAALLYVAKGEKGLRFTLRSQEALDETALGEIAARIEEVAEGMAAAVFPGMAEPEERDYQNRYEYRIQLIKAVTE